MEKLHNRLHLVLCKVVYTLSIFPTQIRINSKQKGEGGERNQEDFSVFVKMRKYRGILGHLVHDLR